MNQTSPVKPMTWIQCVLLYLLRLLGRELPNASDANFSLNFLQASHLIRNDAEAVHFKLWDELERIQRLRPVLRFIQENQFRVGVEYFLFGGRVFGFSSINRNYFSVPEDWIYSEGHVNQYAMSVFEDQIRAIETKILNTAFKHRAGVLCRGIIDNASRTWVEPVNNTEKSRFVADDYPKLIFRPTEEWPSISHVLTTFDGYPETSPVRLWLTRAELAQVKALGDDQDALSKLADKLVTDRRSKVNRKLEKAGCHRPTSVSVVDVIIQEDATWCVLANGRLKLAQRK